MGTVVSGCDAQGSQPHINWIHVCGASRRFRCISKASTWRRTGVNVALLHRSTATDSSVARVLFSRRLSATGRPEVVGGESAAPRIAPCRPILHVLRSIDPFRMNPTQQNAKFAQARANKLERAGHGLLILQFALARPLESRRLERCSSLGSSRTPR